MKWKWAKRKEIEPFEPVPDELREQIRKYGGSLIITLRDRGMFFMTHQGIKIIESELCESQTLAAESLLEKLKIEYGEGKL